MYGPKTSSSTRLISVLLNILLVLLGILYQAFKEKEPDTSKNIAETMSIIIIIIGIIPILYYSVY